MSKQLTTILLSIGLAALLAVLVITSIFTIRMTAPARPAADVPESDSTQPPAAFQPGLAEENGYIFFYNEDGSRFSDGIKQLGEDVYYFLSNGAACTTGYKVVEIGGRPCYYFFEEDGKAFTGGLKQISFGEKTHTFFFRDNGQATTSGWETVDGKRYYFLSNGQAVQDAFLSVNNCLYYFDSQSALVTDGWFCVDSQEGYYYADAAGVLSTDTVVEGYKLDSTGKCSTKYRIVQYVNAHTDATMSDQEKIQALYDWVLTNDMSYIRTYEHVRSDWTWKDSWVDDMAASQMDKWGGNCFRYAAFLGMLIREATGLPVTVYHGQTPASFGGLTPHSWITVCQDGNWYVYDVELQKFSVYTRYYCYMVPASESYIHMQGVGTNLYS